MSYMDHITNSLCTFSYVTEEARLIDDLKYISDHELFVHIHVRVSLFLQWLFFEGKQPMNTLIQGRMEYHETTSYQAN